MSVMTMRYYEYYDNMILILMYIFQKQELRGPIIGLKPTDINGSHGLPLRRTNIVSSGKSSLPHLHQGHWPWGGREVICRLMLIVLKPNVKKKKQAKMDSLLLNHVANQNSITKLIAISASPRSRVLNQ